MSALPQNLGAVVDGFVSDKEYLGSVAVGYEIHAAYPTARATLCGVPFSGVPDPRGPVPGCVECATVAAAFDLVDRSAPPTWRTAWRVEA